jgi:hypothetical protein
MSLDVWAKANPQGPNTLPAESTEAQQALCVLYGGRRRCNHFSFTLRECSHPEHLTFLGTWQVSRFSKFISHTLEPMCLTESSIRQAPPTYCDQCHELKWCSVGCPDSPGCLVLITTEGSRIKIALGKTCKWILLSAWLQKSFKSYFLIDKESNVLNNPKATYYVPEALLIFSSKNTSGCHYGSCGSLWQPLGSSQFLKEPDWQMNWVTIPVLLDP